MNQRLFSHRPLWVGLSILGGLATCGCSPSETVTPPPAETVTQPPVTTDPDSVMDTANGVWEPAGFSAGGLFTGVVVDPTQPATVYATADVSGVYRSDNGGDDWYSKSKGLLSQAIADLAIDPSDNNRIWAATALGLFRSDDRAESWAVVNTELAAYVLVSFQSIAVSNDGQTILATSHRNDGDDVFQNDYRTAILTGELHRSTNGGADWNEITSFPDSYSAGTRFPAVQFDPFHDGVAFLAVSGQGILRSADGGLTWSDFSDGLPSDRSDFAWRSLTFGATSVFAAATQLQPVENGAAYIYRSDSTTAAWASIAGDLPTVDSTNVQQNAVVVRVSSVNDDDINIAYAGFPSLFYKSDDAGTTWRGTSVEDVGAYAFDTVAAPFHNTRDPFEDFIDLASDPTDPNRLFATTWVGIWRSTDRGTTWQEKIRGTQNTVCTDILFTGSEFFATHWDMVLQRTTDPTQSWREALPLAGSPSDLAHGWSIVRTANGVLFVGVSTESGPPRVYRSSDAGTTWVDRSPPFTSTGDAFVDASTEVTMAIDPTNSETVYAVNRLASEGVYRSTDGGESWAKLSSQPASGASTEFALFESLAVDPDDGQRLYAGTFWDGLWYSANGGGSWSLANVNSIPAEGALIGDVVALPGGVVWVAAQDGVYKSTDHGENYARSLGADVTLAEFEYFVAIAVNPDDSSEVFAASAQIHPVYSLNGSVWRTTDGGGRWTDITDDLAHVRVNTLEYADGYLYAGIEGANVFRRRTPYQAPALTDEDLDVSFAAIAELTSKCAACEVDADCDDGDWCNGNEYCDQLGYCNVGVPPVCDDGIVCTYDRCVDSACAFPPALYGDVNSDEVVDLADVLCVLDGFAGQFDACSLESLDIGDCTPDAKIDLTDILAVLDGFQGADPCCGN